MVLTFILTNDEWANDEDFKYIKYYVFFPTKKSPTKNETIKKLISDEIFLSADIKEVKKIIKRFNGKFVTLLSIPLLKLKEKI